jgi:hypothetical protein
LHPSAARSQPGNTRLVRDVAWAGLLVLIAVVVAMVGMQQVPVAHLAMAHVTASEHEHTAETSAHVELESTHDFDDGDPAAPADCCSQTVDYIATVTPAVIAFPVASETLVSTDARELDVRVWAAAAPVPRPPSLIQLSIHRV